MQRVLLHPHKHQFLIPTIPCFGALAVKTLLSLLIFLGIALPRLLDNRVRIRITRNGIRTEGVPKEISWENVLITCIKEAENGEDSVFTLIIHYYDPVTDEFLKVETRLDDISVYHVSATIEYYRSEYIPTY